MAGRHENKGKIRELIDKLKIINYQPTTIYNNFDTKKQSKY